MKKPLIVLGAALLLAAALAQDTPPSPNLEIRLSLVESRLTRVEADLSRLSSVPTQLARIEERLDALVQKADGQGSVMQSIALMVFSGLVGGGIGWLFNRKKP